MIAHLDLDAFFASVAQRDRPELRGKAIAVCRESRRAVVLTASYEARAFGVRSAMPLYEARARCPRLITVEPDGEAYRASSRAVFEIVRREGAPFEPVSLDEGYLDLGDRDPAAADAYLEGLRAEILARTGLTASVGAGGSKLVAKIASDLAKPDGLLRVAAGAEAAFLAPLPAGRLPGVGPKLGARLAAAGVGTIGDLARLDDAALVAVCGRGGFACREFARGVDARRVEPVRARTSFSTEATFERDVVGAASVEPALREQADRLATSLRARGLRARAVGVKVKRADFTVSGRRTRLAEPTDDARVLYAAARHCWREGGWASTPLRLVGIWAGALAETTARQMPLWPPST